MGRPTAQGQPQPQAFMPGRMPFNPVGGAPPFDAQGRAFYPGAGNAQRPFRPGSLPVTAASSALSSQTSPASQASEGGSGITPPSAPVAAQPSPSSAGAPTHSPSQPMAPQNPGQQQATANALRNYDRRSVA